MRRYAEKELLHWKESSDRKPLLIFGARQVGKTWLMKQFAGTFRTFIYINFEKEVALRNVFVQDYQPLRIVKTLENYFAVKLIPGESLLIMDEIQEANGGLTALKYFNEDFSDLHLVAAGSLLGVSLGQQNSFPVGQVDFLHLYPMSFSEFLCATDNEHLVSLIENSEWNILDSLHPNLVGLLKAYYFVGGMPEAVLSYSKFKNFNKVRQIQNNILNAYEQDFSKHAPKEIIPKLRMLWNTVLSQLSKENKKFIYGLIKEGARAKEFELALDWLENYGLINRVYRVNKANFPISTYVDTGSFKIYVLDLGLLGAMGQLSVKTLIDNQLFSEFKGALAEQYVLQELKTTGLKKIFYWANDSGTAELDFIFDYEGEIYPIEVKSNENLQAKSLKIFLQKYPEIRGWRCSLSKFRKEERFFNIPLYAILNMLAFDSGLSKEITGN
jgi:hypothetical protein